VTAPLPLDTLILGAGAAGMFCAAQAAAGGGRVLVVDHAAAPGEKIRISGGGRCNFTNLHCAPDRFLSGNPHFAKSALGRYRAADFVALVDRHRIPWHEKTLGQLFCDGSAREIVAMLRAEMEAAGAALRLGVAATDVDHADGRFAVALSDGTAVSARHLVVATGGRSIPKMGATGFGYDLARRFGLAVTDTRAALVPLTFTGALQERFAALAGVSVAGRARCGRAAFDEGLLFTHRGLSGPAVLQISSYWREGAPVVLSLAPGVDVAAALRARRAQGGGVTVAGALAELLPRRLAAAVAEGAGLDGPLAAASDARLAALDRAVNAWEATPAGTEGWRTAEVTLGGVDTAGLHAATLEAKAVPGLFFVGEVVDVTGWLGGYNFQWAWSSAWAAGRAIAARGA
jgi:predicted Rossmann fold flavoprotein